LPCNGLRAPPYSGSKSTFPGESHVDEECPACLRRRLAVPVGRGVCEGQVGEEGRGQGDVFRHQRVQGPRRVQERQQRLQGSEWLQGQGPDGIEVRLFPGRGWHSRAGTLVTASGFARSITDASCPNRPPSTGWKRSAKTSSLREDVRWPCWR